MFKSLNRPSMRLLRFLLRNCLLGIGLGWVLAAALLFGDVGGLGTLAFESESPAIAIGLLLFGFAITFGSLAMGSAVFMLPTKEEDRPRGGRRERIASFIGAPRLAPAHVAAKRPAARRTTTHR